MWGTKKIIKTIFLSSIIVLLGSYSLYQARNIIAGPQIEIWDPQTDSAINKSLLEITGKASNISYIQLNGRKIFVNEEGVFKEKVLLSPGYNSITFSAQDRFGREIEKPISLFLKADSLTGGLSKK